MRERLFLIGFFAVGGILIIGASLLLPELFRNFFPEASAYVEDHWDFFVALLVIWMVSDAQRKTFESRLADIAGSLSSMKSRIDKLEASRRG